MKANVIDAGGFIGLTRTEKRYMDFLVGYIVENDGVGPSYDEAVSALGLASKSNINQTVKSLSRKGAITYIKGSPRSVFPSRAYIDSYLTIELIGLVGRIGIEESIEILTHYEEAIGGQ